MRSAIVSAFIIILSMSISMVGLSNIIKYGYGYCGYLGIAVVVIPFLTVGVYKNRKYMKVPRRDLRRRAEESAAPAKKTRPRRPAPAAEAE